MSKSFHRLADFILDSYISAALMTATEIAHEVNVDAATVVRFAQTLGYSGFPELHKEIKARVKREFTVKSVESTESASTEILIRDFSEYLVNVFSKTIQNISADLLDDICNAAEKSSQIVFIMDEGHQSVVNQLARILNFSGKQVFFLAPEPDQLSLQLELLSADSLVFCIDILKDDPLLVKCITQLKNSGITTVSIAGAPSYGILEEADFAAAVPGNAADDKKLIAVHGIIQLIYDAVQWKSQENIEENMGKVENLRKALLS